MVLQTMRVTVPESKSDTLRKLIAELVDTNHLARLFHRSDQTIKLWRENSGLPYVRICGEGRDTLRYYLPEVREWAKSKGKRIFPVDGEKPEPIPKAG